MLSTPNLAAGLIALSLSLALTSAVDDNIREATGDGPESEILYFVKRQNPLFWAPEEFPLIGDIWAPHQEWDFRISPHGHVVSPFH